MTTKTELENAQGVSVENFSATPDQNNCPCCGLRGNHASLALAIINRFAGIFSKGKL